MLSAYRIMWLVVMFDLPVLTKEERRAATQFRNTLLDLGFAMSQFSVYMRYCTSPKQQQTLCQQVQSALTGSGSVSILQFTDKQYERTLSFTGKKPKPSPTQPSQYDLF